MRDLIESKQIGVDYIMRHDRESLCPFEFAEAVTKSIPPKNNRIHNFSLILNHAGICVTERIAVFSAKARKSRHRLWPRDYVVDGSHSRCNQQRWITDYVLRTAEAAKRTALIWLSEAVFPWIHCRRCARCEPFIWTRFETRKVIF